MYLRITGGTDNRRQISDWPRYTQRGSFSQRMIYGKGMRIRKGRENRTNNLSDHWFFPPGRVSQSGETMNRRQGRGLNGATIFCFDSLFIFFFSFPPPPPFFPVPRGEIRVAFREMRLYRMITLSTTTSSARTIIASQQDLDLFRRDRGAYTIFYRN